jgi:predicted GTPase
MSKIGLKLVLIGETGIGKSQLGNFILQKEDCFKVGDGDNSETYSFLENTTSISDMNINITIMDTPGLNDTSKRDFDIMENLIEKFQNDRAIDGIILVYNFKKPRKVSKDAELVNNLTKIFGKDILKQRLKVIVTNRSTGKEFTKEKHKIPKQKKDIITFLNSMVNEDDIIFVNTTYIEEYINDFYPEIKKLLQKFYEIKKEHGSMDNQKVKKEEMEIMEKRKKKRKKE